MHISFVFILDERVSTRFAIIGIVNHSNSFNGSVRLEFTSQFGLGCVEVDSSDEERLEWISGGVGVRVRIPQRQILVEDEV